MKIAIAGYGMEGKASYDYWRTQGHQVTVADEHDHLEAVPADADSILGSDAFSRLGDFDLIIRSPSVSPIKLPYGDKVWSATNEFFAKCPAPIIGVTGTKGKGTTCSLIASILRAAGKTVHLVGNIGTPALAELPNIQAEDIVVYELSSFQLWDIRKSPHIAVVLMIEPDHLDVHTDFEEYFRAKQNIVIEQNDSDVVVYDKNNEWSRKIAESSSADVVIAYPFPIDEFKDSLKLPGRHNMENASAAIAVARQFDVSDDDIRRGLADFHGLPHRLKFVAEKRGVKYYDDSIATTPSSAMAAIKAFDENKVIILGGQGKGASYDELLHLCEQTNTKVIAIGDIGRQIADLCGQYGVICRYVDGLMDKVVMTADEMAVRGDVVLLSPAAASFDQYDNYAARGDQFVAAVNRLEEGNGF